MELSFVKEGSKYVCEIQVTSDFNLHIEREGKGFLYVQQKTTSNGNYDSVRNANFAPSDNVIDYDFTGVIYPKSIRVVSEVEPTLAVVTFAQ